MAVVAEEGDIVVGEMKDFQPENHPCLRKRNNVTIVEPPCDFEPGEISSSLGKVSSLKKMIVRMEIVDLVH